MIIRKNILNIVEVGLILFAIYGIGIDSSGKFARYRSDWKILNYENTRIVIDLVVIGIFTLRIFHIGRTIFVANATAINRKNILLITIIYLVIMAPDLYGYFLGYYYAHMTGSGLRLLIYTLPIIIWTYRVTRKQLITPHKK